MNKPTISIIAAVATNNAIGKNNKLLWQIPEDLKHFQQVTSGHPVIMGQKTFESIGKILPGRVNIILSNDKSFKATGALIASTLDDAVKLASQRDSKEIFIIGGGSVYHQTIDIADRLYLTTVIGDFDADTFFPEYKTKFKKIAQSDLMQFGNYRYRFLILNKINEKR